MAKRVQIFVDIGEGKDGNYISLGGLLGLIISKALDENIRTSPGLIEVADDTFNVYSSNADFTFDVSECTVRYNKLNKRRDVQDIIKECFDGNEKYIWDNWRMNAAPVVTTMFEIFTIHCIGSKDDFAESIRRFSNGNMDYDQNTEGKYRFWYRENGEWRRGYFGMFVYHLYRVGLHPQRFDLTDQYLLRQVGLTHLGYNVMATLGHKYVD